MDYEPEYSIRESLDSTMTALGCSPMTIVSQRDKKALVRKKKKSISYKKKSA